MTGWAGDALTFWCCSPRCSLCAAGCRALAGSCWGLGRVWALGAGAWGPGSIRIRIVPRSAALCFLVALLPVSATCETAVDSI